VAADRTKRRIEGSGRDTEPRSRNQRLGRSGDSTVDGADQTHDTFVNGCGGDGLRKGDRVKVDYNPDDPSDFIVNGRPMGSPPLTFASLVALVAGSFFTGGFVVRGWRLHQERSILEANQWETVPVRAAPFRSPSTSNRLVIDLVDDEPHGPLVTQRYSFRNPLGGISPQGELTVAGHGQKIVVKTPEADRLVFARAPRRSTSTRRALGALRADIP